MLVDTFLQEQLAAVRLYVVEAPNSVNVVQRRTRAPLSSATG
jgi:hypothetical protein